MYEVLHLAKKACRVTAGMERTTAGVLRWRTTAGFDSLGTTGN